MATLEDAIHCPKCQVTGKEVLQSPGPKGSKIYTFHCQNDKCSWYQTGWTVQVKADGSIPERGRGEKQFPALDVYDIAAAKKIINELEK